MTRAQMAALIYERHHIRMEDNTLKGAPVVFLRISADGVFLPQDVHRVMDIAFTAEEPFLFYGTAERLASDAFRVQGVDLLGGGRYQFEVLDFGTRMYLYKGGRGESVLRFLDLLREHVSPDYQLRDCRHEEIFR